MASLKNDVEYKYFEEAKSEDEIGPEIIYIYEIYNKMPYVLEDNTLEVYWPYKINGKNEKKDGNIAI